MEQGLIRVCVHCKSDDIYYSALINVNYPNDVQTGWETEYWCSNCDSETDIKEITKEKAMDNEERKLKGLARAMDTALDKILPKKNNPQDKEEQETSNE